MADSFVRVSKNALALEQERLQKLKEVDGGNPALRLSSNKDFSAHERHIARLIRQIGRTNENLRLFLDVVQIMQRLLPAVMSLFFLPHSAMVLLLAEFNRACIYTVPKHVAYSKAAFESKESYYKTIGFREDNEKMESVKDYLKQLEAYIKLYGALIQTEIPGIRNLHGLEEGWTWLARFLNAVPPNVYTATALYAFLQVAGFALFRKYKSQFRKILNIISDNFLSTLKEKENDDLKEKIVQIESYLKDRKFLREPEGRRFLDSLWSSRAVLVPDPCPKAADIEEDACLDD